MSLRSFILGTAGHIDHGKSSLVKALTGTDPDRLPEEKARGMTIELGFAHLDLPNARLGIVDVPGHERFIRTMVSGATGIDLGMLVVAADDGVMPQSREHIEILDLLGVRYGVIAINKCDKADSERIAFVQAQIADACAATAMSDWPAIAVSAVTGAGLEEMRAMLSRVIGSLPPRAATDVFRLAIDRVFAVQGRGTVVTGSVSSGHVTAGATLELQPAGTMCRVREIQSHGATAQDASMGQRAALNLTGIDRDDIARGMELATHGYLTTSRHVDARVRIVARRAAPVESFVRVRVEMGTREEIAMLVVLGGDAAIAPGASGLVQLRFRSPVVAAQGQRFIIRDENAAATLGGGVVIRPVSRRLSGRPSVEVDALGLLESTDAAVRVGQVLRGAGFNSLADEAVACRAGVEPVEIAGIRAALTKAGVLIRPIAGREVHTGVLADLRQRAIAMLRRHHVNAAADPGMPVERFTGWIDRRSAAGMGKALLATLTGDGEVGLRGPFVAHRSFAPALSAEDYDAMERFVSTIAAAGMDPPVCEKIEYFDALPKSRQTKLVELARSDARLVLIGPNHFVAAAALERLRAVVRELGDGGRKFTLAQVRDKLGLSRRVVQPMLEYFDRSRFTRRVGDERVLG